MDKLDAALTGGLSAQRAVIGSMLWEPECAPLVQSKLGPDDFVDGTCRATFAAIRRLAQEGRPIDPVTVTDAMKGGGQYVAWLREVMDETPTAANVGTYIGIVRDKSAVFRARELAARVLECTEREEIEPLARKLPLVLSAAERMPRMTGPDLARDFLERMGRKDKPKYLPWGIPTADRAVYAELGDMVLLGGYASSGKTLLSILMAQAQAKAGYRVGYYSLETNPKKMADRMFAALSQVPLGRIKAKEFSEGEWGRFAEAANRVATVCPFDVIQAAGFTVDDITADAVAHGYQVVYVDYVQLLQAPGVRASDRYAVVTAVSQALKTFAQSTGTAVVALAQLSRPFKDGRGGRPVPPSMHSFRESGQLEQDADAAFLVYPSDPDDNTSNRVFKIGKNKEGPRPKVELSFRGDIQTMVELEPGPDMSLAAKYAAEGRAIKQANRARAAQAQFQELWGGDGDNPFV